MNRYENSSPRTAFGIVALTMTAITFSVLVGLPATGASARPEPAMLAVMPAIATATPEVVAYPTSIAIVAYREHSAAAVQAPAVEAHNAPAKGKQQG
jgi:hypothetical protein